MTSPPSAHDAAGADSPPPPLHFPRPTAGTLVKRALRLRCPRCGKGRLFTHHTLTYARLG